MELCNNCCNLPCHCTTTDTTPHEIKNIIEYDKKYNKLKRHLLYKEDDKVLHKKLKTASGDDK